VVSIDPALVYVDTVPVASLYGCRLAIVVLGALAVVAGLVTVPPFTAHPIAKKTPSK
jgi:hypothetical protein